MVNYYTVIMGVTSSSLVVVSSVTLHAKSSCVNPPIRVNSMRR